MKATKQFIIIKAAFEKVRTHATLGPKIKDRWITQDLMYRLVKQQLGSTYLNDLTLEKFTRGLHMHPEFKGQITRQENKDR
jgi:hypothetical protein